MKAAVITILILFLSFLQLSGNQRTASSQESPQTKSEPAAASGSSGDSRNEHPGEAKGDIARGRYLVEEVAKCTECHTPRNDRGELRKEAWLQGAPIWITPVKKIRNWADQAPPLAGFPSFTEEEGERVLEKGTGPQGEEIRPPMHIYHMKHEDAKAIIAYLKSIPVQPH
jgi:mono/diheme cytochrome c family protein